jgi:hypothetical protein
VSGAELAPEERAADEAFARSRLHDRINNDHVSHKAGPDSAVLYRDIREAGKAFAHLLAEYVPLGRELSTALTKVEEAVFHANAGIARATPATPDAQGQPNPNAPLQG